MSSLYTFTVFAPAYNRAHTLPKLYKTLCEQTFKDFEFIVVDDGSTDNTRDVVSPWLKSSPFPVKYFWKPNGGKHTAINYGVKVSSGRFFAMSDSDDWYTPNALERFLFHWNTIPVEQQAKFSGVCGLFAYEDGKIVGNGLPQAVLDADDLDLRYRYRVDGDLISIKRLEVMQEFPFPETLTDDGAKSYVSEDLVWNRMGRKYLTRFVQEVLAFKEYMEGGITQTGSVLGLRACKANRHFYLEAINAGKSFPLDVLFRFYVNYIRYSLHAGVALNVQVREIPSALFFWLCVPVALALKRRDASRMKAFAST